MKIPTAVMALLLMIAGLLAAAPAATADPASEVTVTWPEYTRFNPTLTTYDISTTSPGDRHLFYTWGRAGDSYALGQAPVPDSGQLDLAQAPEGGVQVRIWSCATAQWTVGSCPHVADSPALELRSRMAVTSHAWETEVVGVGQNHFFFSYAPQPPAVGYPQITWELLDTDRTSFDTPIHGSLTPQQLEERGQLTVGISYVVPADIPTGTYYMDVRASLDTVDYGHLEGHINGGDAVSDGLAEIRIDTDPPHLTVDESEIPATIYPADDNYLDYAEIPASTDVETEGTLEVTDASGAVVHREGELLVDGDGYGDEISWTGRTTTGKIAPVGSYTMTLTVADYAGNTATWSRSIAVSDKKLQWTVFEQNVSAAASRTGKPLVGRCSTLASPARGGRRGSLGYYSQSRCVGNDKANTVATNHGMYLPKAFRHQYSWSQVTLNGGPATRSRDNYIVLGYVEPRRGRLIGTKVLLRGNGAHDGRRLDSSGIWDLKTDKPYIIWSNGLTAGSRYDVRSYTVRVRYLALR
ncbi:hypothetical protein [Nocardioides conyzicola]|uniref:hypothetical protein n=1 Tax=Nocardioides conyzicola TaxID=1651781 RepID=UPI0031EF370B